MNEAHIQTKPKSKQVTSHRPPSTAGNNALAHRITRYSSASLGAFFAAGSVLSLGVAMIRTHLYLHIVEIILYGLPHLDGDSFGARPNAPGAAIGRQVTQAVYGGLQR